MIPPIQILRYRNKERVFPLCFLNESHSPPCLSLLAVVWPEQGQDGIRAPSGPSAPVWGLVPEVERRLENGFLPETGGGPGGRKKCGIKAGGRLRPPAGSHRPATRGGTAVCEICRVGVIDGRFVSPRGSQVVVIGGLRPQTRMKSGL